MNPNPLEKKLNEVIIKCRRFDEHQLDI